MLFDEKENWKKYIVFFIVCLLVCFTKTGNLSEDVLSTAIVRELLFRSVKRKSTSEFNYHIDNQVGYLRNENSEISFFKFKCESFFTDMI